MAFMLGSFTNGLFGGFKDVESAAYEWERLKQLRMETQREQKLTDAGNAAAAAQAADRAQAQQPQITESTAGSTATPGAPARPTGPIAEDPLLKNLPKPRAAAASALPTGAGTSTALPPGAVPRPEPVTYQGSERTALPAVARSPIPAAREQAPQYLPNVAPIPPNNSGPNAAPIPPATNTAPLPPAARSPISMAPIPGAPNLAQSQGLGASILAALNPMSGPNA